MSKPRKFGFVHGGTRNAVLESHLRNHCGVEFAEYANQGTSGTNPPSEVAKMKAAGVTTAIFSDLNTSFPSFASQGAWFPEWVFSGISFSSEPDSARTARTFDQIQWAHAFGVTSDYRRDQFSQQYWYRAYSESCPECPQPSSAIFPQLYDSVTMLFWGIQSAGPRLTADNLDKGMHAIPPRGSPNPYSPAAYFTPGNYSFVKDSAEIWWDGQGQSPEEAPGCYRLTNEGHRYRGSEWPQGDEGIQSPGAPCQGSPSRS